MKRIGVVCALVLCAGCPKKPADYVKPKEMTATDAIGAPATAATCTTSNNDSTLIVDIPEADRAQIEDLVKKGRVPIVGYDCKTLVVKPTCKLESKFDYAGSDLKERVIEIENKDTASAQLPLASAGLQASIKAGQKIDLAIVVVGQKTSKFEVVARPQLVSLSPNECDDATHFIFRVDVGAFAIAQSTSGEAKAAAQVFASGESSASKSTQQREGKLDACKKAEEQDTAPPRDCGVPVRIYMRKIDAKPSEAIATTVETPKQAEAKCPDGTVRSDGGTCVEKKQGTVYICQHDKLEECKQQCDKGQADSCVSYARAIAIGGREVKGDRPAAIAILQKTCPQQNEPKGCPELAEYLLMKVSPPPEDIKLAREAIEHGCKNADARSCFSLGRYLLDFGGRIGGGDAERGLYYYERGCKLGDGNSCIGAASAYIEGRRASNGGELIKKQPTKGIEILDRTCKQNDIRACSSLARYLTEGRFMKKEPGRAATAFDLMCKQKSSVGCAELAVLQITGDGVAKDPDAARETLTKLCYDDNNPTACYGIGLLSELGVGGAAKNADKALELYMKYPMFKDAAARAVRLLSTTTTKLSDDQTASLYLSACTVFGNTDPMPCLKTASWFEAKKTQQAGYSAGFYYAKACTLGEKTACDKKTFTLPAVQTTNEKKSAEKLEKPAPPPPPPPKP